MESIGNMCVGHAWIAIILTRFHKFTTRGSDVNNGFNGFLLSGFSVKALL